MARRCTVCMSEDREAIDGALAAGTTLRHILERFPHLSLAALHRHKQRHLSPMLAAAKQAADAKAGEDVLGAALGELGEIRAEAQRLARAAERKGDYRTALAGAVDAATRLVELSSRLRGLLQTGAQTSATVEVVQADERTVSALAWDRLAGLLREAPAEVRAGLVTWLRARRERRLTERVAASRHEHLYAKLQTLALDGVLPAALLPDGEVKAEPDDDPGWTNEADGWAMFVPDGFIAHRDPEDES